MKIHLTALVAMVAAFTLSSVAAAGPDAAKQRVTITTQAPKTTSVSPFVLTPMQTGAIKFDSGKWIAGSPTTDRVVMRDGQDVSVYVQTSTLKGKLGNLVVRTRQEWAEAGNGYNASTDTWEVVRGTGQYAGITGGGRGASVWFEPNDHWSTRVQGFLSVR